MGSTAKWDAGLYDYKHSFVWKMAAGLVELLEPKAGERILDVGCGTGHLTAQIAACRAVTCGIDQSPEMIRQAREKFPELRFEVMDAREISLGESYDAVFSNAALHWIKEPERVIRGIVKVLKPGGRLVAEFGGKGNVAGLMEAAEYAWKKLRPGTPIESPWFYPGVAEYAGLLERHGLEVTYAFLFDRPTPLEDGERGLRTWLEMFGGSMSRKAAGGGARAAGGRDRGPGTRQIVQGWPVGDGLPAVADRGPDCRMLRVNCEGIPYPCSSAQGRTETTARMAPALGGGIFQLPSGGDSIMGPRNAFHCVNRNLTREDGGRMVLAER